MWRAVQAVISNLLGRGRSEDWNLERSRQEIGEENIAARPSITVLCLLVDVADRSVVADVAERDEWDVFFADDEEQAERILASIETQIVLLDRDMAGRDWRKLIAAFAAAYGACIVLVSRVLDEYLWNEVVSNGGYEILSKPLRADSVYRTVRLARSYRSSAVKSVAASKK